MRFLVTGAGGMLGSAFMTGAQGHEVIGVNRDKLGMRNLDRIVGLAALHRADVLINCAADTNVEAAEDNPALAFWVNGEMPGLLAAGCEKAGAAMVQFSSTGCYGAWKDVPYTEEDELRPTTVFHRSKVAGDEAVTKNCRAALVLRTGWLFGGTMATPRNFVARRLENAQGKSELTADAFQRGNPTLVDYVVRQTLLLLEKGVTGTFNCVAQGGASRAEYVRAIVEAAGLPCVVKDGPSFVRKAPVSPNEMGTNHRLATMGLDIMPEWHKSLTDYVVKLVAASV